MEMSQLRQTIGKNKTMDGAQDRKIDQLLESLAKKGKFDNTQSLEISKISHDRKCDYQNLITVSVNYGVTSRKISGTLIGNELPRITEVQGISVEANFSQKMLYIRNYDKPGFIGSIGTLLAQNQINIGSFHLGRRENSGEAIAIIAIDQDVNNNLMKLIQNLEHVVRVDYMSF